jgi:hypothetical protein
MHCCRLALLIYNVVIPLPVYRLEPYRYRLIFYLRAEIQDLQDLLVCGSGYSRQMGRIWILNFMSTVSLKYFLAKKFYDIPVRTFKYIIFFFIEADYDIYRQELAPVPRNN